jgi:peptide/nickel transport system substrate-binding protein
MTRFDGYYEAGLPYLDEVQFLIMPEPAVRMAALRSHAVDTIAIVTDPEAEAVEKDFKGKVTVYASPSAGGSTVQMNLSRPPFNDPKVRRAVNLAISRQEADLALGPGLRGAVMPPGGPWALPPEQLRELPGYKLRQAQVAGPVQLFPDPALEREEARRLLAEAGLAGGFAVKIHVRADPFARTLAEFAAGQLGQVGIRAEVVPVEPGAYQDMVVKRDFSMIAHSHSFALDDPDAVLFDQYSCKGFENYPGLCDPAVEDLLDRQSRELDPARRKSLVDEVQRKIWEADAKVWSQWTFRRTPVWGNVYGMAPGGPSLYQGRRLEQVWTGQ